MAQWFAIVFLAAFSLFLLKRLGDIQSQVDRTDDKLKVTDDHLDNNFERVRKQISQNVYDVRRLDEKIDTLWYKLKWRNAIEFAPAFDLKLDRDFMREFTNNGTDEEVEAALEDNRRRKREAESGDLAEIPHFVCDEEKRDRDDRILGP